MTEPRRTFLLSPANCSGNRGRLLRRPTAAFPLAQQLREGGAPVGEVFAFISGLYFRGKLAYARAFASRAYVITPSRGLLPIDEIITLDTLEEFACTDIDLANADYREPLARDLEALVAADAALNAASDAAGDVVLLGSVASEKYVTLLLSQLGDRLYFPETFIGRGDMSRGGVMLRAVQAGEELTYIRVAGATRRGTRPPKLAPLRLSQER